MRARRQLRYKRQIVDMCAGIGITKFGDKSMRRFINRLLLIAGDSVTEPDMRVLVRLYNRELIGRKETKQE